MEPNPSERDPAGRGDNPSGRQAAEQPEHSGKDVSPDSLHQGQGPDFLTQDKTAREENPGVRDIMKTTTKKSARQKEAAQHEVKDSQLDEEAKNAK